MGGAREEEVEKWPISTPLSVAIIALNVVTVALGTSMINSCPGRKMVPLYLVGKVLLVLLFTFLNSCSAW